MIHEEEQGKIHGRDTFVFVTMRWQTVRRMMAVFRSIVRPAPPCRTLGLDGNLLRIISRVFEIADVEIQLRKGRRL